MSLNQYVHQTVWSAGLKELYCVWNYIPEGYVPNFFYSIVLQELIESWVMQFIFLGCEICMYVEHICTFMSETTETFQVIFITGKFILLVVRKI
jgi:hypothetical protein